MRKINKNQHSMIDRFLDTSFLGNYCHLIATNNAQKARIVRLNTFITQNFFPFQAIHWQMDFVELFSEYYSGQLTASL